MKSLVETERKELEYLLGFLASYNYFQKVILMFLEVEELPGCHEIGLEIVAFVSHFFEVLSELSNPLNL